MIDSSGNASDESRNRRFRIGLWLCWLSLLELPVGLLAIGGGPCAGPGDAFGSAILLAVGAVGVGLGLFGIARILQGFKGAQNLMRVVGVLSMVAAGFAFLVGAAYLFVGYQSLGVFLRY